MATKRYKFGELNPAALGESGLIVDPSQYDGSDWIAHAVRKVKNPGWLGKMTGPLQAVCIRVENSAGQVNTADQWNGNIYSKVEDKPALVAIRARIPELHSHIPDPECYGPEGEDGVISLYPVFLAVDDTITTPGPGQIIWVDFKDRDKLEHPIYLGTVESKPYDGAYNCKKKSEAGIADKNPPEGGLGLNAPPGDPIGAPEAVGGSQEPTVSARDEPDGSVGDPAPEQAIPGAYEDVFARGEKIGVVEIYEWENPNGSTKTIVADMFDSLWDMDYELFQDTGLKLYVNSGFRTNSEQEALYQQYLDNARPPTARPGYSNHQRGRAIDFSVWNPQTNRRIRLRPDTVAWEWMQANAIRFNFTWEEGRRINEPWHWNYTGTIVGLDDPVGIV